MAEFIRCIRIDVDDKVPLEHGKTGTYVEYLLNASMVKTIENDHQGGLVAVDADGQEHMIACGYLDCDEMQYRSIPGGLLDVEVFPEKNGPYD